MGTEGFGPRVVFYLRNIPGIGDIAISETLTVTWFLMILFVVFSILVTRNMKKEPKGLQLIVETAVKAINDLTESTMGSDKKGFAPYVGTIIIFIGISNIAGLFGLRPPTADLNTTLALAILTFVMTQGFGIKSKGGIGYGKTLFEPLPFLFPINLVGELANPVSLSFRLFGNIIAGVIVMSLVYSGLASATQSLLGISVPFLSAGVPAILHGYFDVFSGLLQSFIFTMLTMVFVAGAMD